MKKNKCLVIINLCLFIVTFCSAQMNRTNQAGNITSNIYQNSTHAITGATLQGVMLNQNNSYVNLLSDTNYFQVFLPNTTYYPGHYILHGTDSIYACTTSNTGTWNLAHFKFARLIGAGNFLTFRDTLSRVKSLATPFYVDSVVNYSIASTPADWASAGEGDDAVFTGTNTLRSGLVQDVFQNLWTNSGKISLNWSLYELLWNGYPDNVNYLTWNNGKFPKAPTDIASKDYVDSLSALSGDGTVISVGSGFGISGGVITSSGTLKIDTTRNAKYGIPTWWAVDSLLAKKGDSGDARGWAIKITTAKPRIISIDSTTGNSYGARLSTEYWVWKNFLPIPASNQLLTVSGGLFTWNVLQYPNADIVFSGTGTRDSIEITNYTGGFTYNLAIEQSSGGSDSLVIYQKTPSSYEANVGGISGEDKQ